MNQQNGNISQIHQHNHQDYHKNILNNDNQEHQVYQVIKKGQSNQASKCFSQNQLCNTNKSAQSSLNQTSQHFNHQIEQNQKQTKNEILIKDYQQIDQQLFKLNEEQSKINHLLQKNTVSENLQILTKKLQNDELSITVLHSHEQYLTSLLNLPNRQVSKNQLNEIQNLYKRIKLKSIQKQQKNKVPFYASKLPAKFMADNVREINFFLISHSFIIFLFALRDKSTGLDIQSNFFSYTFRDWLWANAYITLTLAISFYAFNITLTKLWSKGNKSPQNQQVQIMQPRRWLNILFTFYEVIMTIQVLLITAIKFVWQIVGIYIFLSQIDFSLSSNLVLIYYSAEFMIFFTYIIYTIILSLFKHLQAKEKNVAKNQEIQNANQIQSITSLNNYMLIYSNKRDFNFLLEKFLKWAMIGWVYEIVLLIKDNSKSFNSNTKELMTLRNWMTIDSVLSGLLFAVILSILFYIAFKKEFPTILRLQQKGLFYIETTWFTKHAIVTNGFLILAFMKIVWILYGALYLLRSVNFDKCSTILIVFIVGYITQSIFLIFEGSSIFINGKRAKKMLINEIENSVSR